MVKELRQRLPLVIGVVVVVALLFGQRLAVFLTDWWWFRAIGASDVFTGVLWTRVLLTVAGGAIVAGVIIVNLRVVANLRPLVIPNSPQQAVIEQYRNRVEPWLRWLVPGIGLLFGLSSGLALSSAWSGFLLWRNGGDFGVADPVFGQDVGFYVFDLPWWQTVQSWAFGTLLLVAALSVGAHLLMGGIRPDAPVDKVLPRVKAHLSVLLVGLLALRGWGYWLDRYELNFSPRGTVVGASYTDIHAELPALYILMVATIVAIGLVVWGLRRNSFVLPAVAVGLLVVLSILLQGAYPAAIQRLRVAPQELNREEPYIEQNIEMTRAAYGLTDLQLEPFTITNDLDQAQVDDHQLTFDNIRLWDPELLQDNYQQLQSLRTYYQFHDVDIDRYTIDGTLRQVMLSTRELDRNSLPSAWQNARLTYTHGFGVVASQVNEVTSTGQPVFLASDIPPRTNPVRAPEGRLVPEEPALYFAEDGFPDYAILDTDQPELDYERPDTQEQVTTHYDGQGGVPLGGLLRRVAFGLRFSDPNFVLSNLLNDDSRVTFNRTITQRVSQVAPYLSLDQDPYAVVLGERVVWVQDAYTSTSYYPYSDYMTFATAGGNQRVNYVRNSVKAVVDAYDGTVTLYVVDDTDPIVAAWRRAFPSLYADISEAPEELVAHFRYPEDLFNLQAQLYTTYHITDAREFYNKADSWEIPQDPTALANDPTIQQNPSLEPYYLVMTLPGETESEFVLIQPYVPRDKQNMIAWLAARSDPEHYGEFYAVQFPTDANVLGPLQAHGRIEQESEISREITLVDQAGSELKRGNLLVLPVEQSLLFIEPLFLENPQSRIPELWQVVLVLADRVVMRPTLDEALEALLEAAPPTDGSPGDGSGDDLGEDASVEELLLQALDLFARADLALADGNLGAYQDQVDQGRALLERVARLQGVTVPEVKPPSEPSEPGDNATPSPATPGAVPTSATEGEG